MTSPDEPAVDTESERARQRRAERTAATRRGGLGIGGIIGAVVMAWLSLTPSLLPRGPLFQGLVSGAAAAVGYGLGLAVTALIGWLLQRPLGAPPKPLRWAVVLIACLATVGVLFWYADWQNELRGLMGVGDLAWHAYPILALIAVIVFLVLLAVARVCRAATRGVGRLFGRVLPPRVAALLAGIVVAVVAIAALNGVVADVAMSVLNGTFKAVNQEISDDTPKPEVPERSGGPGSLVSWESLGRQGRIFVANGPSAEELTAFSGRPARTPIRVYTGLDSAENVRAEADLAVAELRRAGGFERAVLGVATTTGTGWINASTATAVEYLANGDG